MRICSGAGCLRVVADDVHHCDECKPAPTPVDDGIRTHRNAYGAELHGLASSPRWQRTRARVLARHPFCRRCDAAFAEIGDHIVPAEVAIAQAIESGLYPFDRYAGYFFETNIQGLCRPCHGVKTTEDKAHSGPWPDVVAAERSAPSRRYSF